MTLTVEAQASPLKADRDGVMRVGGTRVTLDTVVRAFDDGSTAEEIVSRYPALRLADVYAAISYYLNHRDAVKRYIEEHEESAAELWREVESQADYQIFRERLLAATGKTS